MSQLTAIFFLSFVLVKQKIAIFCDCFSEYKAYSCELGRSDYYRLGNSSVAMFEDLIGAYGV